MPFSKRDITPIQQCRRLTDTDTNTLCGELQNVQHRNLAYLIRQISKLARESDSIFGEISIECRKVYNKIDTLTHRSKRLKEKVKNLNARNEKLPSGDPRVLSKQSHLDYYRSRTICQTDLYTPDTRPPCVRQIYEACTASPLAILRSLDIYRTDGQTAAGVYSRIPTLARYKPCDPETDGVAKKPIISPYLNCETKERKIKKNRHARPRSIAIMDNIHISPNRAVILPTPEDIAKLGCEENCPKTVPVDITGSGFNRMTSFRASLRQVEYSKSKKIKKKRRRTVIGVENELFKTSNPGKNVMNSNLYWRDSLPPSSALDPELCPYHRLLYQQIEEEKTNSNGSIVAANPTTQVTLPTSQDDRKGSYASVVPARSSSVHPIRRKHLIPSPIPPPQVEGLSKFWRRSTEDLTTDKTTVSKSNSFHGSRPQSTWSWSAETNHAIVITPSSHQVLNPRLCPTYVKSIQMGTTVVQLREQRNKASKEDRQSSSGNWSGSSTRQSADSDPQKIQSVDRDSALSVGDNDRYSTTDLFEGSSDSQEARNIERNFTHIDAETWLNSVTAEMKEENTRRHSWLTQQNVLAHERKMESMHLLDSDQASSIHSVDTDGFYTSMHTDSGILSSLNKKNHPRMTELMKKVPPPPPQRKSSKLTSVTRTPSYNEALSKQNTHGLNEQYTEYNDPNQDRYSVSDASSTGSDLTFIPKDSTSDRDICKVTPSSTYMSLCSITPVPSDGEDEPSVEELKSDILASQNNPTISVCKNEYTTHNLTSSNKEDNLCTISEPRFPEDSTSSTCFESMVPTQPSSVLPHSVARPNVKSDFDWSLNHEFISSHGHQRDSGADSVSSGSLPRSMSLHDRAAHLQVRNGVVNTEQDHIVGDYVLPSKNVGSSHAFMSRTVSEYNIGGILKSTKVPPIPPKGPRCINFAPTVSLYDSNIPSKHEVPLVDSEDDSVINTRPVHLRLEENIANIESDETPWILRRNEHTLMPVYTSSASKTQLSSKAPQLPPKYQHTITVTPKCRVNAKGYSTGSMEKKRSFSQTTACSHNGIPDYENIYNSTLENPIDTTVASINHQNMMTARLEKYDFGYGSLTKSNSGHFVQMKSSTSLTDEPHNYVSSSVQLRRPTNVSKSRPLSTHELFYTNSSLDNRNSGRIFSQRPSYNKNGDKLEQDKFREPANIKKKKNKWFSFRNIFKAKSKT